MNMHIATCLSTINKLMSAIALKGIVSVYIAKFSNGSRMGIPNKQSSAWVSHLVTSGSSEYSIATKHTQ